MMKPMADTWVEIPGARSPGVTVAITGPRVRLTFGETWAEIEVHPEMEREIERLGRELERVKLDATVLSESEGCCHECHGPLTCERCQPVPNDKEGVA